MSTVIDSPILIRRFKLKLVHVNGFRTEVAGPVSEHLEEQIERWLKAWLESNSKYAKYAKYPYFFFRVETNSSFDRANHMEKEWDFIPVGNEAEPLMFVCRTGYGDGVYDVECEFAKDVPVALSIKFIES